MIEVSHRLLLLARVLPGEPLSKLLVFQHSSSHLRSEYGRNKKTRPRNRKTTPEGDLNSINARSCTVSYRSRWSFCIGNGQSGAELVPAVTRKAVIDGRADDRIPERVAAIPFLEEVHPQGAIQHVEGVPPRPRKAPAPPPGAELAQRDLTRLVLAETTARQWAAATPRSPMPADEPSAEGREPQVSCSATANPRRSCACATRDQPTAGPS
jgi:hypothetical protein